MRVYIRWEVRYNGMENLSMFSVLWTGNPAQTHQAQNRCQRIHSIQRRSVRDIGNGQESTAAEQFNPTVMDRYEKGYSPKLFCQTRYGISKKQKSRTSHIGSSAFWILVPRNGLISNLFRTHVTRDCKHNCRYSELHGGWIVILLSVSMKSRVKSWVVIVAQAANLNHAHSLLQYFFNN